MKTLLLGLPRTASKRAINNLYNYYIVRYGNVSSVYKEPSLNELFNTYHPHLFKYKLIKDGNNFAYTNDLITSPDEELLYRRDCVRSLPGPYIIKHFPLNEHDDFTSFVIEQTDNMFTLFRKNAFDHALSICLGLLTNSWYNSQQQQQIISHMTNTPTIIPRYMFIDVVQRISWYNETYVVPGKNIIDFDDLCTIHNSIDFCKLFNLPIIDFKFDSIGKEFGENKHKMVANISELQQLMPR
jgi:hypothetical protein